MHKIINRSIGTILNKLLKSDAVLQGNETELARRTGVSQPNIYRLRNDLVKEPRRSTIQPIADYFGISVAQLMGEEPIKGLFDETEGVKTIEIADYFQRSKTPKRILDIVDELSVSAGKGDLEIEDFELISALTKRLIKLRHSRK